MGFTSKQQLETLVLDVTSGSRMALGHPVQLKETHLTVVEWNEILKFKDVLFGREGQQALYHQLQKNNFSQTLKPLHTGRNIPARASLQSPSSLSLRTHCKCHWGHKALSRDCPQKEVILFSSKSLCFFLLRHTYFDLYKVLLFLLLILDSKMMRLIKAIIH
ncbi:acyl-CoA-binding domain-containing protein 7 isoform X1 [Sapajus apella]|uniref:Acyl-CoA-binding domain-containing protein 7 isoform X1 n=1 Tax=Sapajus apella TaxID=9515 RepID=A0A6J3F2T5_SAPAP|nr:acyl-CoA-binding domain-containing protein 7 isoform X1 [Sapajus apella]